jgi:hypothetical protein
LYGSETWSLSEEYRVGIFENTVLRIFGPNKEEVAGIWRILHNEELRNLCATSNIIRMIKSRTMRWAKHVAYKEDMRSWYKILVGEPGGKRHSED